MPVKSAKQFRFMQAAAHGGLKGMGGPSKEVASEFLSKTPHDVKSTFAKAYSKKKAKTSRRSDHDSEYR
jgi:hypothetical protein